MADGGGEAFDPMEFRFKRLEDDVAEIKADMKALRGDMGSLRGDLASATGSLRGDLASATGSLREDLVAATGSLRGELASVRADMSYIRGRLDAMPTTIQLLGFIIAIFVASGLTRYFGH
jgi:hypothetical protein